MTDFLLLTLYAPLASWGDIAVGEFRGSWDRPSRSAVLGLIAAGLGLERENQAAHDALDEGYGVAVRADVTGAPLADYHTTQTVDSATVRRRRPATRAELLDTRDRQTILSQRTYRQDALATVALWVRGEARWTLDELRDALMQPRFVLYAGRKANVFGLPLDPRVEQADTLAEALGRRPSALGALEALDTRHMRTSTSNDGLEVSHDPCNGFASGLQPLRRDIRRDTGAHRGRWQFAERVVEVGVMPAGAVA
ncbi:MAG: type I-E CRISPR-associated protein Cas5/CasD [Gemmatimonadaceae bacterium]